MIEIYWIYALFGDYYYLNKKGYKQNIPQKRNKIMDCAYLIILFCWNIYLKSGFGLYLNLIFDKFYWDFK